jgi:hypothetical protein
MCDVMTLNTIVWKLQPMMLSSWSIFLDWSSISNRRHYPYSCIKSGLLHKKTGGLQLTGEPALFSNSPHMKLNNLFLYHNLRR